MTRVATDAWETRRPLLPELALVVATAAYGSTFVLVQDALERVSAVGLIFLRFTVGAAVLLPFAIAQGWRRPGPVGDAETGRSFLRAALLFGVVGFIGYWFQNTGLERTTTSNSAFITGLFVVFTPLVETVVRRRVPPRNVLAAIAVCVVGLFFLTGAELSMNTGDALTVGCALFFGIWVYLGGEYSQRFQPVALTAAQMVVLAVLALPFSSVQGIGDIDTLVVVAVLVTGIVCSAGAFTVQLWGQRFVEPSRAAVILLFEPVVAGVVGYSVGERLGVSGYVGATIILGGILLAESRAWRAGLTPGEPPGDNGAPSTTSEEDPA
ncbi:MAG TPA: DMT family transporter [Acidimicrobiia bacterium]|nr:DMT family transporter [Acidimicrobiia bacterium]